MKFLYIVFTSGCLILGSGAFMTAWLAYKRLRHPAFKYFLFFFTLLSGTMVSDIGWNVSTLLGEMTLGIRIVLSVFYLCCISGTIGMVPLATAAFIGKPAKRPVAVFLLIVGASFLSCLLTEWCLSLAERRAFRIVLDGGVTLFDNIYLPGVVVFIVGFVAVARFYVRTKDAAFKKMARLIIVMQIVALPPIIFEQFMYLYVPGYETFYFSNLLYLGLCGVVMYRSARYLFQERPTLADAAPEKLGERFQLSGREQELLPLLLNGLGNKQIAWELKIKLPTVKQHLSSIYRKTGAAGRYELMNLLIKTR